MKSINDRSASLDFLRSFGLLVVLIGHYSVFVSHDNVLDGFYKVGWVVMELFFVLSSYLISNQIFVGLQNNKFQFKIFFIKRYFKTLPNYYFILALYLIIPAFSDNNPPFPLWKYLLFMQNFKLSSTDSFDYSWSLCVEEQFYLIFPFILVGIYRFNKINIIPYMLGLIIIIEWIVRGILWNQLYQVNSYEVNIENYLTYIYAPTYCRLDGLVGGVLISYFKNKHQALWHNLTSHANLLIVSGVAVIVLFFMATYKNPLGLGFVIFGFSCVSLGFTMICIAALSYTSVLARQIFQSININRLAIWSYAIYLIHKPVAILFGKYCMSLGLNNDSWYVICTNIFVQIFVGFLLFYFWEDKFTFIRDKLISVYSKKKSMFGDGLKI